MPTETEKNKRIAPLWCRECQAWAPVTRQSDPTFDGYTCDICAEDILCDGCGQAWVGGHRCGEDVR